MNANAAHPNGSTRVRAERHWRRVVEALGFRMTDNGQTYGQCPVHGGDKESAFSVGVGEEGWPVLDCKTGCADEIADDRDRWYAKARRALLATGVPEDCLAPARGAGRRSTRRVARTAGRTSAPRATAAPPSEDYVALRAAAMTERLTERLATNRGLTAETIEAADIGWDAGREQYVLPVRDPRTGELNDLQTYRIGGKLRHRAGGTARLYAPPSVDLSRRVFVCEGAWDALTAWQHRLNAVAVTGGAGTVPRDLSALEDRAVVIVFDCDDEGRAGAEKLAAALQPIARSVAIANLGLPDKGDVRDWFVKHRRTVRAFRRVVSRAEPWEEAADEDQVLAEIRRLFMEDHEEKPHYFDDLLFDDDVLALPDPTYVVDGWVPRAGYTVFWGRPGVYKTFVLNEMQRSVRRGAEWHGCPTEQGITLMLQGEGLAQLKPRIQAWERRNPLSKGEASWEGAHLATQPDIGTPEGVSAVVRTVRLMEEKFGKPVGLVILDPLVEFFRIGALVESTDMVSRGLRALALHLGCGVVAGHHANADGERARGTEHLFMRSAAWVQMETLEDGLVGIVQHKQKNGQKAALVLAPVPYEGSLVLELHESPSAEQYVGERQSARRRRTQQKAAEEKPTVERVLAVLQNGKDGCGYEELRASVGGRSGDAGQCIAIAVEKGLVGKVPDQNDRRKVRHVITEQGREHIGATSAKSRVIVP